MALVQSWQAWRDAVGGSAKGEVSVKATDQLLMNINIKLDGTHLIAPRWRAESQVSWGSHFLEES